jgi:large subunit ribosomal protein L22
MTEVTAKLNSYRQSPRKVRLVANLVRGKRVLDAKNKLGFTTKRAVNPLHKLLDSAIANAKNLGLEVDNLFIKSITVNGGQILYRRMPVSRGSAHPIRKRTSHVTLVLSEKALKVRKIEKDIKNKVTKSDKK